MRSVQIFRVPSPVAASTFEHERKGPASAFACVQRFPVFHQQMALSEPLLSRRFNWVLIKFDVPASIQSKKVLDELGESVRIRLAF